MPEPILPAKTHIVKLPRFAEKPTDGFDWRTILEVIALAVVLGLIVWVPPPDVNEAHYLAKARHFWNRTWCSNDLFASSHETHWLFYATFGWLTRLVSLETTAWIGRVVAWLVVSWGLIKLIRCIGPEPWQSLLLAPVIVLVNRYGHLAGEWFVGGIEAKAIAWGFVFAGLAQWLRRDWLLAFLYLSVASGFHVVIGLWTFAAMVLASLAEWTLGINSRNRGHLNFNTMKSRTSWKRGTIAGVSIVLLLCGILPAFQLNQGASGETIRIASECQAFFRLAHHQDALRFGAQRWTAFLAMVSIWIVLVWSNGHRRNPLLSKLNWIGCAAIALDLTGLALSIAGHNIPSMRQFAASFLVLYWFRLADVMVPVVVVLNGYLWISNEREKSFINSFTVGVPVTIALSIAWNAWSNFSVPLSGCARQSLTGSGIQSISLDEINTERDWQKTCRWIGENTPVDAVFVTPINQQTFKWYAERSEVVNWKDMPQDAMSIVIWKERMDSLYSGFSQPDYGILALFDHQILNLAERYKASFIVVETRFVNWRESIGYPPAFERVYPERDDEKSTFTVFKLSEASNHVTTQVEPMLAGGSR